jgi:hypothetical protein
MTKRCALTGQLSSGGQTILSKQCHISGSAKLNCIQPLYSGSAGLLAASLQNQAVLARLTTRALPERDRNMQVKGDPASSTGGIKDIVIPKRPVSHVDLSFQAVYALCTCVY